MNKLNPRILSEDELVHYAAIDAVEITPGCVVQLTEQISNLAIDRDTAEELCAYNEEKVSELEAEVDEAELHTDNAVANLRALMDELRVLFTAHPNLKNTMPELYGQYLRVES